MGGVGGGGTDTRHETIYIYIYMCISVCVYIDRWIDGYRSVETTRWARRLAISGSNNY